MADRTGQQLGKYLLESLLGQGGFAEVYLGRHQHLNTYAAIKVLKQQCQPAEIRRFFDEARIVANLQHPHIVRILDFDVDPGGTPYLVMEHALKGTLRQHHGPGTLLAASSVLSYIKQTANALQFVHQANLVHQDVKPENLLVNYQNTILLSDFGIAFATYQAAAPMPVGTIHYMAPEQLYQAPCAASDQYALGIVTYEWLCGDCPFTGTSNQEIADKHINMAPPSLRHRVPGISPLVEEVVLRSLEKRPEDRYASVWEYAQAFEQVCLSAYNASQLQTTKFQQVSLAQTASIPQPPAIQPPVPPTIPPGITPIIGKPTLPIQQGKITSLLPPTVAVQPPASIPPAPPTQPIVAGQQGDTLFIFREHRNVVRAVDWSLDGKLIVSGDDDGVIHVWEPFTGKRVLTYQGLNDQVRSVKWAPTGRRVVSAYADQSCRVWDATSGNELLRYEAHVGQVDDLGLFCAVAWSDDGCFIASASADRTARVWSADTGDDVVTYRAHKENVHALAWSPDSSMIATASYDKTVHIWKAATGETIATYHGHKKPVWSLSWSLDGRRIASACSDGDIHVWDALDPLRGEQHVYCFHTRRALAVAWSLDGTRIVSGSADRTAQLLNPDTKSHLFTYCGHQRGINALAWSPDGFCIASASDDETVHIWRA